MSTSPNSMESPGHETSSGGWVTAGSDDGYAPIEKEAPSTRVGGYSGKYVSRASSGLYQTAMVSTPESRRRDRLKRLNKRFRALSNAY